MFGNKCDKVNDYGEFNDIILNWKDELRKRKCGKATDPKNLAVRHRKMTSEYKKNKKIEL